MTDRELTGATVRVQRSFSCSDEVWDTAKSAWSACAHDFPAWAWWLETALAAKADETAARHPGGLEPAPAKLPPGRRERTSSTPDRTRRSFTCRREVWDRARAAWWTEQEQYPSFTEWAEEALTEAVERTRS
ncbi:hypothetical protein [Rhodococcus rhodnii]|uniref:hypothetical protein n=1 Tax=Rhodococcus rhodnii TaxID=38312 RepID=UPI000932B50D|nr:hypothetical protein [Rhodococcus rhodnii]